MTWPKSFVEWTENGTLFISVPFTWDLPAVRQRIVQRTFDEVRNIRVGGPATVLMPDYLKDLDVKVGGDSPGALQRHNPDATRTTVGCPNRCLFCAVPKVEGVFRELPDWPDGTVICDNNLLKASVEHFDRVCDRLERYGRADFNQGLDARLLNDHHAERLKRIGDAKCRLALDHKGLCDVWENAFSCLRKAGVNKKSIGSYVLVGFDSGLEDAWSRCRFVEEHGVKAYPMWYHELDALKKNVVTQRQASLGWTDSERRRIMQWFYKHKNAVVA